MDKQILCIHSFFIKGTQQMGFIKSQVHLELIGRDKKNIWLVISLAIKEWLILGRLLHKRSLVSL